MFPPARSINRICVSHCKKLHARRRAESISIERGGSSLIHCNSVSSADVIPQLTLQVPQLLVESLDDLRVLGVAVDIRHLVRIVLQVVELPDIQLAVKMDELVAFTQT